MKRSGFAKKRTTPLKRTALRRKSLTRRAVVDSKGVKTLSRSRSATKPKTAAKLKKEFDSIFSKYVRLKNADHAGNVACYTCGKVMHWRKIQNGHFVSRQYLATRWHENNCRPQCWGCNGFGNGKVLDFEEKLKAELGAEYVEAMKKTRHKSLKLDRQWYEHQILIYQAMLDSLPLSTPDYF